MSSLTVAGTFSKDPSLWGVPNLMATKSLPDGTINGSMGDSYIDWVSGLGAIVLGNGDMSFNKHMSKSVMLGNGFSLVTDIEHIVADKLASNVRDVFNREEVGVRFMKTGTDATSVAVRLARAITGKYHVVRYGYNGWNDWSQTTPPARGVPLSVQELVHDIGFGDINEIEQYLDNYAVACVIIEHPAQDPPIGYYDDIRELCDKNNSLFIMDEVVTGLRYGVDGACGRYEISPDLVCYGKSLGNGYPISAVVGKKRYMDEFKGTHPVFCSSTSWGDTVSLNAANYVLNNVTDFDIGKIWEIGGRLIRGLKSIGIPVFGHGGRFIIEYKDNLDRAVFIRCMHDNSVLANRPFLPTMLHTNKQVDKTLHIASNVASIWNSYSRNEKLEYIGGVNMLPMELFKRR